MCVGGCEYQTNGLTGLIESSSEQCTCDPLDPNCFEADNPIFEEPTDLNGDGIPDPLPETDPTDTSDDTPDADPLPEDDDGDGDTTDELNEARNKILDQIEDNTDEVEQLLKNQITQDESNAQQVQGSSDEIKTILNNINDSINNIDLTPTPDEPGNEDKCPAGQYLIGEDCVFFPNSTPSTDFGQWDDTTLTQKITDSEEAYNNLFSQIKSDLSNIFTPLTVNGTCAPDIKQIKGVDVDFSGCQHLSRFDISKIILLVASIISLTIIFAPRP